MRIDKLSDATLLEEYSDMVKWYHYDPMCTKQPSKFDLDELEAELRRRLRGASGRDEDGEDED